MKWSNKMCSFTFSTKRDQVKIERVDLRNWILKYDVIHDAFKVICYKNLKRRRNLGDFNFSAIVGPRYGEL